MDDKSVREQMMSLWKETFGDSSEYVNLVFENYFNPEYVVFQTSNDIIVSALLGVPYEFESCKDRTLKGLYLCGLATKKNSRRKGLMTRNLEEINNVAINAGFDFTFLIPSGLGIKKYYSDRGYHDSFYKCDDYYVRGHKFTGSSDFHLKELSEVEKRDVVRFLNSRQAFFIEKDNFFAIRHSEKDWDIVLNEAVISAAPVYVAFREGEILGVAFTDVAGINPVSGHGDLLIKSIVSDGEDAEQIILKGIEELYPDINIINRRDIYEVFKNPETNRLWRPFVATNNGRHAEYEDISDYEVPFDPLTNAFPYGMIKIPDVKKFLKKCGINDSESFKMFSDDEIIKVLFRHPSLRKGEETLDSLLHLPYLSLSVSLLLE